jgi:hypothetical protein
MISDTPISDSTPHNVADLGMLCRKFERELYAAKEMFRKLNIHALDLTDRIRRLEAAGDRAIDNSYYPDRVKVWTEAKEAKP